MNTSPTTYRLGKIWGSKPPPPDLPGPQLIAHAMRRLGVPYGDVAYALCLHPTTLKRWIAGKGAPHRAARRSLEALRAVTMTPDSMTVTLDIRKPPVKQRPKPGRERPTPDAQLLANLRTRLDVTRGELGLILAAHRDALRDAERGDKPLHDVTRQYVEAIRTITHTPEHRICVTYSLAKLPPNRIRRRVRTPGRATNDPTDPRSHHGG